MGGAHDAFEHLGEVTCPVTVAVGGTDDGGPASFAARIADGIPGGRLLTFAELGHFGPLEQPAAVAASVAEAFSSS
jgi:pimeloyl-ACP methyl ester carboxylesterase